MPEITYPFCTCFLRAGRRSHQPRCARAKSDSAFETMLKSTTATLERILLASTDETRLALLDQIPETTGIDLRQRPAFAPAKHPQPKSRVLERKPVVKREGTPEGSLPLSPSALPLVEGLVAYPPGREAAPCR